MARLHESLVSLRIVGDSLDPDEITRLLGCQPTSSGKKDEVKVGKKTGIQTKWRMGAWILDANNTSPADVDRQVNDIFGKLSQDIERWHSLSSQYTIDLSCGFMMNISNEGLELSPKTLRELGLREVTLSLSLYGPA